MPRRTREESLRPPESPPVSRRRAWRSPQPSSAPVEMPETPEKEPIRGGPRTTIRVYVGLTVERPSVPLASSPPLASVVDALRQTCLKLGHPFVLHVGTE